MIAQGLFSYQIGGSEKIGVELALELKRRGFPVVCFAFHGSEGPMRAELERAGIRCLDVNYDCYRGILKRPRYLWDIWRMLRRERVQALHVHHAAALILCGIPAWLARVRTVLMTEHGLHQLREQPRYRRSARYYCRYASDISVVEPTQIDYFHEILAVPRARLHFIANGTRVPVGDAEYVRRTRRQLGLTEGEFAFFYAGRLHFEKDLGTLLRAFAALPADVLGRSRLYLVGEGAERASLEATRDALGLGERAAFLGPRGEVGELLLAADAFVMSSKTEGLPMVLLEAMAARIPCVATAVGGIPELFAGDRGLAVTPGDAAALAAAMAAVARSPELRARLVANALENLRRNHSFETMVERYLQLLGLPVAAADSPPAASSPRTG
ncbi:MAG TPA: glycosyltransferase [Steroidobacteraceae bacterium]|nr:glycosyltransferase [Steroidobacteraceae bacterium]